MRKRAFNDGWFFALGGGNALSALAGSGPESAVEVLLPHDAEIGRPRDPESPGGSGNGFFRAENCYYTKEFELEAGDNGQNVWLMFDGIYHNSYIYINGAYAGRRPYGYSRFYIDATQYVKYGEKNTVRVIVKNGVGSGRWYTGGGIYRDVYILISNRLHYRPEGIHLSTVDLEKDLAVIQVDSRIEYTGIGTRSVWLKVELLDCCGETVAEDILPVTVFEHTEKQYRQRLYVRNPELWSDETPYLYRYRAAILEGDREIDTEVGSFGIRKLTLDPQHGLRINGRTVKLRGGCIHHDNGIIGAVEFPHSAEVRIRELKKAGYNAVRSAHNPMSPVLLDACDRLGMYVMDEFADTWTSAKIDFDYGTEMMDWWKEDIHSLVDKDFNHPSVIMYSIGNEVPEAGNAIDTQWGKLLADEIRMLDPTRYTTNSINLMLCVMDQIRTLMAGPDHTAQEGKENGTEPMEINSTMTSYADMMQMIMCSDIVTQATAESTSQVDIVGLNYALARYDMDHMLYPNRILVGSETNPPELDVNWKKVMENPYVIGDFSWTAWDYLGETGIGKILYNEPRGLMFYSGYPTKAAYCADFNLIGDRRPISFWREIIWGGREQPYLCVQPPVHHDDEKSFTNWCMTDAVRSWNYEGQEGKSVTVEVYADAEEAELFVNGRSVGRKPVGEEKKARVLFETVYEPGTLSVVAYKNGIASGTDEIVTAQKATQLCVAADRKEIPSDGSDICYIDVTLTDHNGVMNPNAHDTVHVLVEGAGVLQGYGSADPDSEENYFDTAARAFEGRLRAVIRSNGQPGEIRVTFSAEEMKEIVVILHSI